MLKVYLQYCSHICCIYYPVYIYIVFVVLNGEIRTAPSTFKALNSSSVPYRVFGMINMCDAEKIIEVDRRVLLYYKYDFDTVDCVKVLRNKHRTRLNIRFLQVITYQSYPGGHGSITSQKSHQKLDGICNSNNLLIYTIFHIFSESLILA